VLHLFNLPDVCPSSCAPLTTDCELHHPSSTSCSSSQRILEEPRISKTRRRCRGRELFIGLQMICILFTLGFRPRKGKF
jgi:hypothetical protein